MAIARSARVWPPETGWSATPPMDPPPPHRPGADEGTEVTEARRRDARPPAVWQPGVLVEGELSGVEERGGEAERHAPPDDHQREVERVAHRGRSAPDEPPGPLHDLVRRLGRRSTRDHLDRQAGCLGLEASLSATPTSPVVQAKPNAINEAAYSWRKG